MAEFLHVIVCGGTDFTDISSNLVLTTEDPGGCGTASWSVVFFDTDIDAPPIPDLGSFVAIADGNGIYWLGRLEEPQLDILQLNGTPIGKKVDFLARGYGSSLDDQVYKNSMTWTAGTAFSTIIRNALRDLCPSVGAGNIAAGNTLPADSNDAVGSSAQTLINQYCSIGNPDGQQLSWGVWPDAAGTNALLDVFERNQGITDYTVDIHDVLTSPVSWPLQWVKNEVVLKWNQGVWSQVDAAGVIALDGLKRDVYIDASSSIGDFATAQYTGNAILTNMASVRAFGKSIEIDYSYGLNPIQDTLGNAVPPWRIRAGRNIEITGLDSGNANLPVGALWIKATHWNEDARKLTLETEQRESLGQIIGRAINAENKIPTPTPTGPVAPGPSAGSSPDHPIAQNTVAGANYATLDSKGRLLPSEMPEGWDIVSLNFAINGGGVAVTAGLKGFIGLDYGVALSRIAVVAVQEPSSNCTVAFKIWVSKNVQTTPISVGAHYITQDGGTDTFILTSGKVARFAITKTAIDPDSLIGFEIISSPTPTATIGTVWLSGNRLPTKAANVSPHAPSISDIAVSRTTTLTTVTWKTDSVSDSQVEYGTTSDLSQWSARNQDLTEDTSTMPSTWLHTVTIPGVSTQDFTVTYQGRVISVDTSGRESSSSFTF